ncbi:MAG: hypothetical protein JXB50_13845, partial [Spirochaetes bacterium]|nr:hypothetical protein [Spirochaetota bacterium]
VLRTGSIGTQTWLNEMCSLVAEDLIADKLQVNGPRGITYSDPTAGSTNNESGRLPLYNAYNDDSVNYWQSGDEVLRSYAINYAFGAYLARNFGGANLFNKIVQCEYSDEQAINYALNDLGYTAENFTTALQKWGAANLLSDNLSPPAGYYKYNQGDIWFTSTKGSITYNLGSINLYNYKYIDESYTQTGPYIYIFTPVGSPIYPYLFYSSNRYYRAGNNITGILSESIDLKNSNVKLTVVIK